jgi:signal transduction histidine kinase
MTKKEEPTLPFASRAPAATRTPLLSRAVLDDGELREWRSLLYRLIDAFLVCALLAVSVFAGAGMLIVPWWAALPVPVAHAAFVYAWRAARRGAPGLRREFAVVLFSCSTVVLVYVGVVRDPVSTLVAFMNMIIVAFTLLLLTPGHALALLAQTLAGIIVIRLVEWNTGIDAGLAPMPDGLVAAGGVGWLFVVMFASLWVPAALLWRQKERNHEARTSLAAANLQLRDAERARNELLSAVTHELRTPLVAILGYVDLMQRNAAVTEKGLPVVKRSAVRLQRLIEELINAAEPPDMAARVRLAPVVMAELIAEETAAFQAQAASLGVDISVGQVSDCVVSADRLRLGQVLSNLIDNALRHSPAGSAVVVSGSCEGGMSLLTVADRGRGMSAAQMQHIFEPFYTRAAADGEKSGMGLGLSICFRLVAAMNGTIQVESAPGKGTVFSVRLPLAEVRGAPPPAARTVARALVLDDEVDVLHLMQATLSELGFAVDVAQNGVLALDMAMRTAYDLVLLDLNVPGLTGVEVARRLRAAERPGRIMLFSALIDRDAGKIVAEAHADGFVPKPFNFDALERLVGDLVPPAEP